MKISIHKLCFTLSFLIFTFPCLHSASTDLAGTKRKAESCLPSPTDAKQAEKNAQFKALCEEIDSLEKEESRLRGGVAEIHINTHRALQETYMLFTLHHQPHARQLEILRRNIFILENCIEKTTSLASKLKTHKKKK